MIQYPQTITRVVGLISVGKYLERIADHVTNIAEDVIYHLEGKVIKHHKKESEDEIKGWIKEIF